MALVAWYKLDGNALDSSGNKNHGTASGVTWTSGKIGQGRSDGYITIPNNPSLQIIGSMTISFWIYINSMSARRTVIDKAYGGEYTINLEPSGCLRFYAGKYGGNGSPYSSVDSEPLTLGRWYHATIVRQSDGSCTWYINGNFSTSRGANTNLVGSTSSSSVRIGTGYTGGNVDAIIDDVRIYDHALSPKEVKELAKAKILHYPFDSPQEPTENIIYFQNPRIDSSYSSYVYTTSGTWQEKHPDAIRVYNIDGKEISSYINTGVTDWTNKYHAIWTYDEELGKPVVTMRDFDGSWKAKSFGLGKSMDGLGLKPGDKYTISWLQWTDVPGKAPLVGLYGQNTSGTNGFHDGQSYGHKTSTPYVWERMHHTFTVSSNWNMSANLTLYMYGHYRDRGILKISDVQLELKDHPTPFSTKSRESSVYDSSGYDYHAKLSLEETPEWVEDPEMGGSYRFNGSQSIKLNDSLPSPPDQVTVSAWVKTDDASAYQHVFSKGVNTISCAIYQSKMYCKFNIDGVNRNPKGNTILQSNRWYHLVWLYDGTNIKFYIDGKLDMTSPTYTGQITEDEQTTIIGAEFSTYPMNMMKGLISDVRVYATALSEKEIMELYRTKISIDNMGNMYAHSALEMHNWNEHIQAYNLLENGDMEYKNNYNLTSFEYDQSNNYFFRTSGSSTVMNDNYIRIQGDGLNFDRYRLEGWIKGKDYRSRYYFMIACYDKEFRRIDIDHVYARGGTATVVARDLNPGDEWLYLDDVSSWYDDGTSNYVHQKQAGIWLLSGDDPLHIPYKYTRRLLQYVEVDKANSRVKLRNPYSGTTIPAGSLTQNHQSGSTYSYIAASNTWTNLNEWEFKHGTTGATASANSMRPGTAYVRVGFLINRESEGGTPTTLVRNLRFYNVDRPQKLESEFYVPGFHGSGALKTAEIVESGLVGSENLIAYYPLNGDTRDYSGSGYHGVNNGATVTAGIRGGALSFNQYPNYVDIPYGNGINTSNPLTISLWAKVDNTDGNTILFAVTNGSNQRLYISKYGSLWEMAVQNQAWNGGVPVTLGSWTHLLLTMDGSNASLYVNGVLGRTKTYTPYSLASNFRIGNHGGSSLASSYQFIGSICDVRIYNRALAEEEIKILYNTTKPDPVPMQISNNGIVYLAGELKEV